MSQYSFAVLTTSDKGARGEREDTSGPALIELLKANGFAHKDYRIVPDCQTRIKETILEWCDRQHIDLIVSTGGTGLSPSDLTPEATRPLLEREIPGMAEAMRAASLKKTANAMLSRALAGTRGGSLIINLPGSKKGALENMAVVLPTLKHAIDKIKGSKEDCQPSQP